MGTPIALSDSAGVVHWKAHYTTFGKAIVDVDNFVPKARFPGQYFDQETGLHYNYFRDYDPEIGRYIQSDPIGLAGGINTYGYVGGNPIGFSDPKGLNGLAFILNPLVWGPPLAIGAYYVYATQPSSYSNSSNEDEYDQGDPRYGGYTPADEKEAVELANSLTGEES